MSPEGLMGSIELRFEYVYAARKLAMTTSKKGKASKIPIRSWYVKREQLKRELKILHFAVDCRSRQFYKKNSIVNSLNRNILFSPRIEISMYIVWNCWSAKHASLTLGEEQNPITSKTHQYRCGMMGKNASWIQRILIRLDYKKCRCPALLSGA